MTADALTPSRGIRLKGGAPIPPAPSFGIYRPVALEDSHIGGVTELAHNHHVPVCIGCHSALPAHPHVRPGQEGAPRPLARRTRAGIVNANDRPCDCPASTDDPITRHTADDHAWDCGSTAPGEACGTCWACIASQVAYHQVIASRGGAA